MNKPGNHISILITRVELIKYLIRSSCIFGFLFFFDFEPRMFCLLDLLRRVKWNSNSIFPLHYIQFNYHFFLFSFLKSCSSCCSNTKYTHCCCLINKKSSNLQRKLNENIYTKKFDFETIFITKCTIKWSDAVGSLPHLKIFHIDPNFRK